MTLRHDDDFDLINQILDFIGYEYEGYLIKASNDESLYDFLDHMESYGYWDSFKWNVKDVEAFRAALESTYN